MKNIEWLKEEVKIDIDNLWVKSKLDTDSAESLISRVNHLIDQLDEPEVLSQEWITENSVEGDFRGVQEFWYGEFIEKEKVQNLLVPKQEEVDQAYKDGYEKGKQHTFYKGYLEGLSDKGSEPETVADVVTTFWKSYERLKEVMNIKVKELEE